MNEVVEVIVEVPSRNVNQAYDYLIPEALIDVVKLGSRVIVPFGARRVQGYVIHVKAQLSEDDVDLAAYKEIESVLDETPPLTEELIRLGEWMSKVYVCLMITALQTMLPSVLKSKSYKTIRHNALGEAQVVTHVRDQVTTKKVTLVQPALSPQKLQQKLRELPKTASKQKQVVQFFLEQPEAVPLSALLKQCQVSRPVIKTLQEKGLLQLTEEELRRDPYAGQDFPRSKPLTLTAEQQAAHDSIIRAIDQGVQTTFMLHGVTGSGKTEIYLQAIAHVLKQGKEAIVLVPEISLTPQMVTRFKSRFGEQVAVLHSRLSKGERYDEWLKIQERSAKVVIGARSALFAPFTRLGLIIIDEEHEASYKQEETPRYHARDVALFRGKYHMAPVVLGSATPTLESYARAEKGVYHLLPLHERVHGQSMPSVQVVDMREELREGNRSMFSRALSEAIEDRLLRKEQMVLFLNRRGFATFVMCRDCGYVLGCPHCDISLTYHKTERAYRCHYCGYLEKEVHSCPECQSDHIRFFGTGTQKVEEELHRHFPGMRIIRMDVDTTGRKGSHEKMLTAFGHGEADCLLGTQMIAKGLDFERVTLVGVLAADSVLHLPDFRAAERTFQLLTQVSGRAGRHKLPGEVIVQSYTPDHYSIQHASTHDYASFYKEEMEYRRARGYPPYYYLVLLTFSHEDVAIVIRSANQAAEWLKKHLSTESMVLGPVASPLVKIKDRYRYHCMIKYKNEPNLNIVLSQLLDEWQIFIHKHKLTLQIDKQPQMLM